EGPVPDRYTLAIVVLPADGHDRTGDGVPHAQHDHHGQEGIHDLVHHGGRGEDGADGTAPVDQDDHADHRHDAGQQAAGDGHHVVGLVADADRVGPRLRYQQPDDVPADDAEHAEVEQGAADPQELVLVELGGAGGPTEL